MAHAARALPADGARALVLLGHGARDPSWATPFHRLKQLLSQRSPSLRVELAFLDFIEPRFPDLVARLAGDGVRAVDVLPVFVSQGGHVRSDVVALVEAARRRWPAMAVGLLPSVGDADVVLDAIARFALAAVEDSRRAGRAE